MATFKIVPSSGQWFWRLKAANGETVSWSGELYTTKQSCVDAAARVKSIAATGLYETYTDVKGEYRWRLKAGNGQIVAVSEGYSSATARDNSIAWMRVNAPTANIEVIAA